MQQQEQELGLRHYERSVEIERQTTEADEKQTRLEIELKNEVQEQLGR